MNTACYGVKNSKTGQFFAGFDENNEVLWTGFEKEARSFGSHLEAKCQADLFHAMRVPAQRNPVML